MNTTNKFVFSIPHFISRHAYTLASRKARGKFTTVKKLHSPDPKIPALDLEQKNAADVIQRLNTELKGLFGPVIKSSSKSFSAFYRSNRKIQRQTSIPTAAVETSKTNSPLSRPSDNTIEEAHLDWVLNFPLTNNSSLSRHNSSLLARKFNSLRKYFEKRRPSHIPSVSKILEKTMAAESALNLKRWKEKMIQELGEEGFEKYYKELLATGSSLHISINQFLNPAMDTELHIEESNAGHWKSLESVFPKINEVKLLEKQISHPFLHYKGIVDCFANYREHLVVIDWKTSKKKKASLSSTFDNPLQIAAYVGALNFDPNFKYLVNKGLIVVAYESGIPATPLFIDEGTMQHYWKEWLRRVKLYWEMTDQN